MTKKITFTYGNNEYKLEYNRASIEKMENNGVNLTEFDTKPLSSLPKLFHYAFLKNHSGITEEKTSEILTLFTEKETLISTLMDMITECVEPLLEDNKTKNAIKWEVN